MMRTKRRKNGPHNFQRIKFRAEMAKIWKFCWQMREMRGNVIMLKFAGGRHNPGSTGETARGGGSCLNPLLDLTHTLWGLFLPSKKIQKKSQLEVILESNFAPPGVSCYSDAKAFVEHVKWLKTGTALYLGIAGECTGGANLSGRRRSAGACYPPRSGRAPPWGAATGPPRAPAATVGEGPFRRLAEGLVLRKHPLGDM